MAAFNQQLYLTEMKLLQKSNAELAHQNHPYHLSMAEQNIFYRGIRNNLGLVAQYKFVVT